MNLQMSTVAGKATIENPIFSLIEAVCISWFTIEYFLRLAGLSLSFFLSLSFSCLSLHLCLNNLLQAPRKNWNSWMREVRKTGRRVIKHSNECLGEWVRWGGEVQEVFEVNNNLRPVPHNFKCTGVIHKMLTFRRSEYFDRICFGQAVTTLSNCW